MEVTRPANVGHCRNVVDVRRLQGQPVDDLGLEPIGLFFRLVVQQRSQDLEKLRILGSVGP